MYYIQIYPVSEGILRKIPVERRGKYPEPLTLTNRIYLFNSAEYLTASKTVHASRFRTSDHLDYLIFSIYESRENLFKEVTSV